MELELGLKITHTRDDLTTTTTDLRIAKDPFGPLFWSKETNSMFILVIHLKGFRSERIEVEINKEGNQIVISGKKAVEEMVLIRWLMWRKEVELRAFRKVFQIPDVVDLDKIKARFNEEESTLKITMPKKVKGISGLRIEEYKEEEVEDVPDREHIEEAVEETNDKPPIIMKEAEVVETESPKELSKQEETSEQAEISSVEEQKEEPKDLPDGDGEEEIVAEESINLEDKKVAEQKIEQNVPEKVEEREAPVVENLLKETPDIPEPETPNEPVFDATQSAEEETLLPHESIEPQVAELLLPVEEPPDTKEPEVEEVPEIVQPATESPPPNKSPDTNITNENHEHPNEDEPSIDAEESIKPEPFGG